jgi:hypothetical protein
MPGTDAGRGLNAGGQGRPPAATPNNRSESVDHAEQLFQLTQRLEAWRQAKPTRWYWIDSPGSHGTGDADNYQVNLADEADRGSDVGEGRGTSLAAAILAALDDAT